MSIQPSFVLRLICLQAICQPSRVHNEEAGCVFVCVLWAPPTLMQYAYTPVGLPFSAANNHWTLSRLFKMASSVCLYSNIMERIPDEV